MSCRNNVCPYGDCYCPKFGWVITHDFLNSNLPCGKLPEGEQYSGPGFEDVEAFSSSHEILDGREFDTFRLLDDDGIAYFYGYIANIEGYDAYDGFEPLDFWGRCFGCTEIQYLSKDFYPQWQRL